PPPTEMPARIGRFEIRRYLGEGSFGRVYEAHDPLLDRVVALKVAKPEQLSGPRRGQRFQREARAAANLMHPNIVAVFDSGQEGGHHYIASAFVSGRSLAELIEALPSATSVGRIANPSHEAQVGRIANPSHEGGEEAALLPLRDVVDVVRKLAEALGY